MAMNLNMAGGAQGMMKEGSTLADGVDEAVLKNIGVRRGVPGIFVDSSLDSSIARRHAIAAASSRCLIRAGHQTARKNSTVVARPQRHEEADHQPPREDPSFE